MQVDIKTLVHLLRGKSMIEADHTLDAARRIVWTVNFIGGTWEQAAAEHAPTDEAAASIAQCFEGVPLTTANAVLSDVRLGVWMFQCQGMPDSRYAQQAAARAAFVADTPATDAEN